MQICLLEFLTKYPFMYLVQIGTSLKYETIFNKQQQKKLFLSLESRLRAVRRCPLGDSPALKENTNVLENRLPRGDVTRA